MKTTKLLFIALMLLSSSGFSQTIENLDEKNGFRDMKFGMPVSSFKNLIETISDEDIKYYEKSDEVLTLGNYDLQSVTYVFYKNQLYVIAINTEGYLNNTGVLSIMQNLYGEGEQSNEDIEYYSWMGERVFASYKESSIDNSATISFLSYPIMDQRAADKKQTDKEEKM